MNNANSLDNVNIVHYYIHNGTEPTPESIVIDCTHLESASGRLDVNCFVFKRLVQDMIRKGVDFSNFCISAEIKPYVPKEGN